MVPLSDYEHLIYEQRGPVTVITINRPERMNAFKREQLMDRHGVQINKTSRNTGVA